MSLRPWDERIVPRLTDASLRGHEIGELRARVCAGLTGRVVEIGFGSSLNIRWCPPEVTAISALATFSLCTIPDPALALRELRRVVRPGGRLHFLEHGLSPVESFALPGPGISRP